MDKADWDNSDELRRAIERELDNWGAWSRQGNRVNLGHPSQIPGAGPPERDPPRSVNLKQAEETERAISSWCSSTVRGRRMAFLLKLRYVERLPLEAIATHYGAKFKQRCEAEDVADLLEAAEVGFWLLTT